MKLLLGSLDHLEVMSVEIVLVPFEWYQLLERMSLLIFQAFPLYRYSF